MLEKHCPRPNHPVYGTVRHEMLDVPHKFTYSFNDLIGICSLYDIFEDLLG